MKFLTDIIHEQNRLLALAADTIDALMKERNALNLSQSKEFTDESPLHLKKIKAMLIERDIKINDIANLAGVSPTTVSVVITGKGKSIPIQKTIAEVLNVPYETLWRSQSLLRR